MDTPEQQIEKAKLAIGYVLLQIKKREAVANVMGFGTESFSRLTAAAASLWQRDQEAVEEYFSDPAAVAPKGIESLRAQ